MFYILITVIISVIVRIETTPLTVYVVLNLELKKSTSKRDHTGTYGGPASPVFLLFFTFLRSLTYLSLIVFHLLWQVSTHNSLVC